MPDRTEPREKGSLWLLVVIICLLMFIGWNYGRGYGLDLQSHTDSVTLTLESRADRYFYQLDLGWDGVDYNSGYRPCPF